jgi:hypothetical protein
MNEEFSSKQLVSVTIILLTHKMVATFEASVFHDKQVTPEMVCEVIESIGFNCTLVSITELKGEE